MTTDQYEIIPYKPAYREPVLTLLAQLWGSDRQQNERYLAWKYDANPDYRPPVIFLALQSEQVIGVRCFLPMRWQVGSQSRGIACLQDVDTVIHPDHLRRGLFREMSLGVQAGLAKNGYRFTIAMSGNRKSIAALLNYGWRPIETLQWCHWRITPEAGKYLFGNQGILQRAVRFLYRRLRNPRRPKYNPFKVLDRHFGRTHPDNKMIRLIEKPEPEGMLDLVNRCNPTPILHQTRDLSFFTWRFENPKSAYRFLVYGEETLSGYLVLQTNRHGSGRQVVLVDWVVESPDIFYKLLTAAKHGGLFNQISTWSIGIPADHRQVLAAAGFRPTEDTQDDQEIAFKPYVLIHPLSTSSDIEDWTLDGIDLLDIKNWDLRPICSDIY
jgi:hypothetical protein